MFFNVKTLCVFKNSYLAQYFDSDISQKNCKSANRFFLPQFFSLINKNAAFLAVGLLFLMPLTAKADETSKQQSKVKVFVGENAKIFSPDRFSQNTDLVFQKPNLQTTVRKNTFKSQNEDSSSTKRISKDLKKYKVKVIPVLPFGSSSFISEVLYFSASLPQNFQLGQLFGCKIAKITFSSNQNIYIHLESGIYKSLPDKNYAFAKGNLPPPENIFFKF